VTDTGRQEVALAATVSERSAEISIEEAVVAGEETTDEQSIDGHLAGPARHESDRDGRQQRDDLEGVAVAPTVAPEGVGHAAGGRRAWQGLQVRAALCATERDGVSDSSLYREAFADFGGPLYTLERIPAAALGRRRRYIRGVGDFADLRRLMTEVAR
jgi:hypothetical protein